MDWRVATDADSVLGRALLSIALLTTAGSCGNHDERQTIFRLHNLRDSAVTVREIHGDGSCCTGATIASGQVLALNVNGCLGWTGETVNDLMALHCANARFDITYGNEGSTASSNVNVGPTICDVYDGEIRVGNTYEFSLP